MTRCKKIAFKTKVKAEIYASRWHGTNWQDVMKAYLCPFCKNYHLTQQKEHIKRVELSHYQEFRNLLP